MHKILFAIFISTSLVFAEDTIKIGSVFSLTGFGALGGDRELKAVSMAIEEINAAGGIAGKKIEFTFEDNQSDLKKTANAVSKLIDVDGIQVLIGPNWAEFSEVAAPIVQRKKVPMISASGNKRGLTKDKEFVFTLFPSHFATSKNYAEFILKQGYRRPILLSSQNAYYEEIADAMKHHLKEKGISLVDEYSVDPDESNFRTIISKINQSEADVVIAFLLESASTPSFLRQRTELKLKPKIFMGPSPAYHEVIINNKAIANGIYFFDFKTPQGESFLKKYQNKYKTAPVAGSDRAYDAVNIVKECLVKDIQFGLDLANCIAKTDYKGVSGRLRFDKEGEVLNEKKVLDFFLVKDAEFVKVK